MANRGTEDLPARNLPFRSFHNSSQFLFSTGTRRKLFIGTGLCTLFGKSSRSRQPLPPADARTSQASRNRVGGLARLPSWPCDDSRAHRCQRRDCTDGASPCQRSRHAKTLHQTSDDRSDRSYATLLGDASAMQKPGLLPRRSRKDRRDSRERLAAMNFIPTVVNWNSARRRGGRVAEGGGLLNRYTG